jgi:N4-gp56 family major capsid protein
MPGQVWSINTDGGYMHADELSTILRIAVRPLTKMRQFCDAKDGTQKGLNRGEQFTWNVYGHVGSRGTRLNENAAIPETSFSIRQGSLTVTEFGNSVPFTGKLDALAQHKVIEIIDKALKNDCARCFDVEAFLAFDQTPLTVGAAAGTSTTAVTVETTGSTITNNVAMGKDHLKAISDAMKERNIPPYMGDSYMGVSHPTTWRPVKNDLETIHQYTESGLTKIMSGEIGKYEDFRLVEQNSIPKGGAVDSVTYDPLTDTADPWNNSKSSWAFFFGADTCAEAVVIPEEIRAKISGDYGRAKGVAWYAIEGFGCIHTDATNARIMKWESAA